MPNVTVCTNCGSLYEAGSEEQAHEPSMVLSGPATHAVRYCLDCVRRGFVGALIRSIGIADPNEAELIRRRLIDADDDGLEDLGD
jgi:hypothetical protein